MSEKAPPPEQPGIHTFPEWDLADLLEVFDWTPFFRAWELAGTFPAILDDEVVGESARSLYADARAMLKRILDEKLARDTLHRRKHLNVIDAAVAQLHQHTDALARSLVHRRLRGNVLVQHGLSLTRIHYKLCACAFVTH